EGLGAGIVGEGARGAGAIAPIDRGGVVGEQLRPTWIVKGGDGDRVSRAHGRGEVGAGGKNRRIGGDGIAVGADVRGIGVVGGDAEGEVAFFLISVAAADGEDAGDRIDGENARGG